MTGWIEPVTLQGRHTLLEPLRAAHHDALCAAAADGELWRLWYTSVPAPNATRDYIDTLLAARDAGTVLPFAVRRMRPDGAAGEVVGCTRYLNVDAPNRRLEIGGTWYARSVQRTGLNTEAKLLLLGHAFEQLDAIAVELRTHFMNRRSRAAIERLGAKQDGILRQHQISPDGVVRDTVVYSIVAAEWPAVRRHLQFALDR